MAQEIETLNTRNSAGFFDGLFGAINNALPLAANVAQLKIQGDVLKNQLLSQTLAAPATVGPLAPPPVAAAPVGISQKTLLVGGAIVAALLVLLLILRRR